MNQQIFHKTPISFWLLMAAAILITEACLIYLSLETQTSFYDKPGSRSFQSSAPATALDQSRGE